MNGNFSIKQISNLLRLNLSLRQIARVLEADTIALESYIEKETGKPFETYRQDILTKFKVSILQNLAQQAIEKGDWKAVYQLVKEFDKKNDPFTETSLQTSKEGYVYIIFNERNGYYKIGFSKSPKTRELTLQAEEPEITMIFCTEADKSDEKQLHEIFDKKRIRGEWFSLNHEDIESIKHYLLENIGKTGKDSEDNKALPDQIVLGRNKLNTAFIISVKQIEEYDERKHQLRYGLMLNETFARTGPMYANLEVWLDSEEERDEWFSKISVSIIDKLDAKKKKK